MDTALLSALDGLIAQLGSDGSRTLRAAAAAITPLGGSPALAPIVAAVAAWLAWRQRRDEAVWLVVTCVAGWAAMHAMKFAAARPRPDAAGHLVEVVGASFPSGHAMMATVVALALWLLARREAGHRPTVIAAGLLAGALVLAIGTSRVLLGVHWPTDVLAGWALGAAWTGLAWRSLARRVRARQRPTGSCGTG